MNWLLPILAPASFLLFGGIFLRGEDAAPSKPGIAANQARKIPVERTLAVAGQGYFPVALRLRDGRIAVVLRGGGPHLSIAGRLDIIFSEDEGATWSKPALVVDSPIDDRNPAMGEADDGTLVVGFWRTATYDEQGHYNPKLVEKERSTWVTRSQDGGRTWSAPASIDCSEIGLGSPYGRMVTLPDGALLMAIYGYAVRAPGEIIAAERQHSYLYRSSDRGLTWKRFAEIGADKDQLSETSLLRLANGQILAALRTRGDELRISRSTDGGQSWSPPQPLAPAHFIPGDLCQLADGRVLLTMGNRLGPFGVIGIVGDGAGHCEWGRRFALVTDAATADCGYPSSVSLAQGRVLTLYYATKASERPDWGVHAGAVTFQAPGP